MTYNIKKLTEKFETLSGGGKNSKKVEKAPAFTYWKPTLTDDKKAKTYNVRFLPYVDQNEQPFQEVDYYDEKKLSPYRLVAPVQFHLEDPIAELVLELRKDRKNKAAWSIIKPLLPRPRFYAPLLVREEAPKGVQVWELSPTIYKDLISIMISADYCSEDVTHPEAGYDFQVTVLPTAKVFKNPTTGVEYPVNEIKVQARNKPSPLAKTEEERQKLINSTPKLLEHFTAQCRSAEQLREMLEKYLAYDVQSEAVEKELTEQVKSTDEAADQSVLDQFAGL